MKISGYIAVGMLTAESANVKIIGLLIKRSLLAAV